VTGGPVGTVLLHLEGPQQSWPLEPRSRFIDTARVPTKRGVAGLVAACLGRAREESRDDLAALRMGVRIDRPGEVAVEFQSAATRPGMRGEDGGKGLYTAMDTTRQGGLTYKCAVIWDAVFTVGLEGDRDFVGQIAAALRHPVYAPALGRRAHQPSSPVALPDDPIYGPGLVDLPLEEALAGAPYRLRPRERPQSRPLQIRAQIEPRRGEEAPGDEAVPDMPDGTTRPATWGYLEVRRWVYPWDGGAW